LTLTINGDIVDFRLENERILREALQGVEEWLSGSGLVITAVHCDGKLLAADDLRTEGDRPLERVRELAFDVRHARELRLAALREQLSELADRERTAEAGEREEAARRREEASCRLRETMETYAALQALAPELAALEEKIGEVSVLLQSGKDRQAMETVTRFTDLIEAAVAALQRTGNAGEAAELFSDLNPRLREILGAFDAKDFILVGDLFEYEVAPRLGKLSALLARCA
jgi:hypothetical protein